MILTGRVLDNSGNGLNGVSVTATPVGSGVVTATVTTATVSTEAGVYTFAGLADGTYKIDATYNGQTREIWGNASVQYGALYIGSNIASWGTDGKIVAPDATFNGNKVVTTITSTNGTLTVSKTNNNYDLGVVTVDDIKTTLMPFYRFASPF